MIKKSLLALFALITLTCGVQAQFSGLTPGDLGSFTPGSPINGIFDIGTELGLGNDSDVTLNVSNGFVTSNNLWTVADGSSTTFTLGGPIAADVFVNHGRNLGSDGGTNGSGSRDGITATPGESWTLDTTTLDSDYTFGSSANDYFVDYTGTETNAVEFNNVGFNFRSAQPVSTWTVFSTNTVDLDNNYSIGFRTVAAIPEPTAASMVAISGLFFLRRKRS